MSEEPQPTHIYHYTDTQGFKGIVENQEIWATDIFCLNDRREFYHGKSVLVEALKAISDFAARERMLSMLETSDLGLRPHTFVCSFSAAKNGDDLSQWRAYCPNDGYAVGFPTERLAELGKKSHFALRECAYGSSLHYKKAEGVFAEVHEYIESIRTTLADGEEPIKSARASSKDFASLFTRDVLCHLIAVCKDEAFSAEAEWRLVSLWDHEPALRFRASGSLLVPYTALNLADHTLWEQVDIVVSPCSHTAEKLRLEFVKMFVESELRRRKLPTTCVNNVRVSEVPYRSTIGR